MVGRAQGLVLLRQVYWMHWPSQGRGGARKGCIVCQGEQSSNELNASLWFGHFADIIFWGTGWYWGRRAVWLRFCSPLTSRGRDV